MRDRPGAGVRTLRSLGAVAVLVQIGFPVLLLGCKNAMLFHPSARPANAAGLAQLAGVDARLLEVTRPDGRVVSGYDARPRGARDTPVLLYLHGNASNAAQRAPWLRHVVEATGLRVVLASYSGYGGNPGSPSEDEIGADALAFFDRLVAEGVPPAQIVVYGESIGGGPATQVATERRPAGLILQSTLSSLSSMADHAFPWLPLTSFLTRGDFPNAARAAAATCPVLVVHGTADGVIPFSEAERISEAAPRAELVRIEGAGHNDLWSTAGPAYVDLLVGRVRAWTSAVSRDR